MKRFFNLVVIGVAVISLFSCKGKDKNAADGMMSEKPEVKLTKVQAQDIAQTETYTATVESDVKNNISPNMQVRIQKVYVDVGDYVRKGQVVVALDPSNMQQMQSQVASQMTAVQNQIIAAESQRQQVQTQQVQVQSQMAQLQNKQAEFNRTAELYRIGGASKSEYDAALTALKVAQSAVAAQQSGVKVQQNTAQAQEKAIQQQRNQLAVLQQQMRTLQQNTNLVSPISGVVTARHYDDGDMYSGTPVLTIEQLNPVKLIINVSEALYSKITLGMQVGIELEAYPGETFGGTVAIIYPSMDKNTHTFPVEIRVPNDSQRVRPGMFGKATLDLGSERHVTVPDEALVKQVGAGDRYVYVYRKGKVYYTKVELGQHIGSSYEIKSGLKPGEQIVIAGQSRLANGKEVEVKRN